MTIPDEQSESEREEFTFNQIHVDCKSESSFESFSRKRKTDFDSGKSEETFMQRFDLTGENSKEENTCVRSESSVCEDRDGYRKKEPDDVITIAAVETSHSVEEENKDPIRQSKIHHSPSPDTLDFVVSRHVEIEQIIKSQSRQHKRETEAYHSHMEYSIKKQKVLEETLLETQTLNRELVQQMNVIRVQHDSQIKKMESCIQMLNKEHNRSLLNYQHRTNESIQELETALEEAQQGMNFFMQGKRKVRKAHQKMKSMITTGE